MIGSKPSTAPSKSHTYECLSTFLYRSSHLVRIGNRLQLEAMDVFKNVLDGLIHHAVRLHGALVSKCLGLDHDRKKGAATT